MPIDGLVDLCSANAPPVPLEELTGVAGVAGGVLDYTNSQVFVSVIVRCELCLC